ncbi:MAG: Pro-sigmaK processing inhibitor BofA [Dorea sp.]|jgi:SigmaK-factor processing regulatory protein BofA.|nr:Pro-sigmaK processing inhibitor BofA [Dorea sp.]
MPERQPHIMINFFVRVILGIAMIFFVNEFLEFENISVRVGMNPLTLLTSGVLGTPGVALLYGIAFYRGL